jgi:protein-ribulosamine 3-kinase
MSLNALHAIIPSFCPKSHAQGALSKGGYFLATDFLDLSSTTKIKGSGLSFASKLAQLHTTPAPMPEGFSEPQFGFPVPTCCGSTVQPNDYSASWADFFANNRMRAIGKACKKGNGSDAELAGLIEKTAAVVVPRLLGDGHLRSAGGGKIVPVVVHGDLWAGNHGRGSIGEGGVEDVVYDPSSCYGHSEYDLGIMKLFGGFGRKEYEEYHDLKPKDEPVEEYGDRVELYAL